MDYKQNAYSSLAALDAALMEIRRLQEILAALNSENIELKARIAALKDDMQNITWEHMEEMEMME